MSENTKIEWCTHSWSPWRGCTKVSPGCANCYADALASRFGPQWGGWGKGVPRVLARNWSDPVRWDKASLAAWDAKRGKGLPASFPPRPTVFPSLCDWLDEEVPVEWLVRFLTLIHDTPNLTWLLLTKRPENWHGRLVSARLRLAHMAVADAANATKLNEVNLWIEWWRSGDAPPANVWVGTSVEDQTRADERIPHLLDIPAAGRFLSVEPLLGEVDLPYSTFNGADAVSSMEGIHWVIVGGESGPGSRTCNVDWVRGIVSDCRAGAVPVFVKQLGANPAFDSGEGYLKAHPITHPKGGDPAEWPEHLRVREFPVKLGGAR